MTKCDYLLTLDIGCTAVRACAARYAPGTKPEVVGIGMARRSGITRGVVTDVQQTTDAVAEAVAQATSAAGKPVRRAVVALGGEAVATFPCVGATQVSNASGTVAHDDVHRAIRSASQRVLPKECEELHAIPRGYRVDKRYSDTPIGMHGGYLEAEVQLVAAHSNALRTLRKCVRMAGLRVDAFVLDALAGGASAMTDDLKQSGAALVDFGGDHTTVVVYSRNRVVHIGEVPIGGSHLTSDIEHCFGIPPEAAELIKQGHGFATMDGVDPRETLTAPRFEQRRPIQLKRRKLAWVIEARIDEWLQLLRNQLAEAGVLGCLPGGITLVGGGAMLGGLAERTAETLHMDCVVGYADGVTGHLDVLRSPIMATTVGLIHCAISPPGKLSMRTGGLLRQSLNRAWAWAMEAF